MCNFANDMDNTNEIEMFSPEEMQSPFEAIKETDGEGREWWNSRKEIDELLSNKLSEALTDRQKYDKITNLLSSLKRKGIIAVDKNRNWVLVK